jgi:hypothetical protein
LRSDEAQPRSLADATERLGGEQGDIVASFPQHAADSDERVHIAAGADWREKKMRQTEIKNSELGTRNSFPNP